MEGKICSLQILVTNTHKVLSRLFLQKDWYLVDQKLKYGKIGLVDCPVVALKYHHGWLRAHDGYYSLAVVITAGMDQSVPSISTCAETSAPIVLK